MPLGWAGLRGPTPSWASPPSPGNHHSWPRQGSYTTAQAWLYSTLFPGTYHVLYVRWSDCAVSFTYWCVPCCTGPAFFGFQPCCIHLLLYCYHVSALVQLHHMHCHIIPTCHHVYALVLVYSHTIPVLMHSHPSALPLSSHSTLVSPHSCPGALAPYHIQPPWCTATTVHCHITATSLFCLWLHCYDISTALLTTNPVYCHCSAQPHHTIFEIILRTPTYYLNDIHT